MNTEPQVVFADDHLLIIDKPPGMPTQPDAGRRTQDLHAWARLRWPHARLLHRLDQPASGLVAFGLSSAACTALTEALQSHALDRRYRALLSGPDDAWGRAATWTGRIGGRAARTEVVLVGAADGLLAIEARLHTGRTHQLRIHAAMAQTPIVGDRRYGGPAWHPRLALHAWRLSLRHPTTRAPLDVEAPLADDLLPLWERATRGSISG